MERRTGVQVIEELRDGKILVAKKANIATEVDTQKIGNELGILNGIKKEVSASDIMKMQYDI